MPRVLIVVSVSLVLAGCAAAPQTEPPALDRDHDSLCGSGKCDEVDEAGTLPLEGVAARVASVVCRHAQVCNATDSRLSILTEDECRAEWTTTWARRIEMLGASIRAGRTVYEAARAEARIDEVAENVRAGRCLVDNTIRDNHLFRGTVAAGETCRTDECAEGLTCRMADTFQCAGTCTDWPSAAPTGSCTSDDECMPEEGCLGGTCGALSPVAAGELCHRSAQCTSGLFCQPSGDGTRRCEPPRADGQPCDAVTICGRGSTCRIQEDGSHVCGLSPGNGDVCDGILVFCRQLGLVCDWAEDGVSRCRPMGREGDACTGGDCDSGLRCHLGDDWTSYPGVCRPARLTGEPCRSSEDCLGDWCGPGNVCVDMFGSLGCSL